MRSMLIVGAEPEEEAVVVDDDDTGLETVCCVRLMVA
jgi:hypothetical protein